MPKDNESTTGRHPLANAFFYRFFNDRMEDPEILPLIDETLYGYVTLELMRLKADAKNANSNTFSLKLYDRLQQNYPLLCKQASEAIAKR